MKLKRGIEVSTLVEVWLPYGKTEVVVNIPDDKLNNILKRKKLKDESGSSKVAYAVDNPLGDRKLADIVTSGKKIAIAVQEPHNTGALTPITQEIIEILKTLGSKDDDIIVIISGNLDYPRYGNMNRPLLDRTQVHSFLESDMLPINTAEGTIKINKIFKEADVKIAIGMVEPHFLTGYSGAPYAISPGLLDIEKVLTLYKSAFKREYKDRHLFQEALDNASNLCNQVGVDFTINVAADNEKNVAVVAGETNKAFLEAVKCYEEEFKQEVKKPIDVLIGGVGGAPFDSDLGGLYQGIDNALTVAKKGGQVILATDCGQWVNSKPLLNFLLNQKEDFNMFKRRKVEQLLEFPLAFLFMKAKEYGDISIVSVTPQYYTKRALKFRAYRTVNQAVMNALNRIEKSAKILVAQDVYHTIFNMVQ